MVYLSYIVLAILVIILSVRLSFYVDELDKKTNLSGAFIGGIMLAAVTSLPELFTSLTAVLSLDKPELVQGNVLGSNIFNLCVIGGLVLCSVSGYQRSKVANAHKHTLIYSFMMYILAFFAMVNPMSISFGFININIMTVAILMVYIFNVINLRNDEQSSDDEEAKTTLSVRQILLRFALYSIALVSVSILLTNVTDQLAEKLQLGTTVAGAIFLGVATSLPELSASISLIRMGNYNASFGNVIGSNLFNFTILCFGDIIYTKGSIFMDTSEVMNLLIFGIISTIFVMMLLYFKKNRMIVWMSSLLILVSYIVSIMISM